jgi:hypothetical protein
VITRELPSIRGRATLAVGMSERRGGPRGGASLAWRGI